MLIDGEKYACEACVRGHRVSTCQHHDRPLTHINKKGRPVSQCPHCRGLRKARAAHVACECGSKPHQKDDCGDIEAKSEKSETPSDSTSDLGANDQRSCCCSHGLRCTCALKKEPHLDTVLEMASPLISRKRATSASKPRMMKTGSDNSLTVFTNGHHKPIHKHNDSAHQCGMPYKIPIPHSVHGNADVARRSTDSLPMMRAKAESHPHLQDTLYNSRYPPRMARSEHGSPEPGPTLFRSEKENPLPPFDLSYTSPLNDSVPAHYSDSYRQSPQPQEVYYEPRDESPLMSAGLNNTTVGWSDLSLPLNNTAYSTTYTQPPTYISLDNLNTGPQCPPTSSSGEGSDTASDYISHSANQGSPFRPDLTATSSADARSINRLSSSSFTSIPQSVSVATSIPTQADSELSKVKIDPDYQAAKPDPEFYPTSASPVEFQEPHNLHADAYERHGLTVHDIQKMAHPETPTEAMNSLSLPAHADDISQALWANRLDPPMDTFVSQDMVESMGAALPQWR